MAKPDKDERIDKRCVTMRSVVLTPDGVQTIEAKDYVRPDLLDAYVADARNRWQVVEVGEEPDAGPGGYDGATTDHLGRAFYPATGMTAAQARKHAPEGYEIVEG